MIEWGKCPLIRVKYIQYFTRFFDKNLGCISPLQVSVRYNANLSRGVYGGTHGIVTVPNKHGPDVRFRPPETYMRDPKWGT